MTDLDNTLWDWVRIWHEPVAAMLRRLAQLSGVSIAVIEAEARKVHQRHRTSEYAFLVQEIPSLVAAAHGDPTGFYADAIHIFRRERARVLRPYPDVRKTLTLLRDRGTLIVAYTESRSFYAAYRLRKTGVDGLIDVLYSPPDHELPAPAHTLRKYDPANYELATMHRHTSPGEWKPNPKVLLDILRSTGAPAEQAVYVGDSVSKDIAMAQEAGILDVHALYGAPQGRPEYELLRRLSYWTDEEIESEKAQLASKEINPSLVLRNGFSDILDVVEFGRFVRG